MLKKMNLPNKLTMLRIVLVPIFVVLMCLPEKIGEFALQPYISYIALAVYVIAAFTDFLDGRISRKNKIVTKFGKIMDPLADKLLVSTGFIMLTGIGLVPAWVTAIIVFRDFFVNALRMFGSDNSKDVAAGLSGKVKTLFQMSATVLALVNFAFIPKIGFAGFMTESMNMGVLELLINVGMTVTIIGAVITTVWSFVDYFLRFKEDINVVD